jgi:hypothetical protein
MRGRQRTRELHVAARTLRAASVRAMPWEGAAPRSARGPDGEAGATLPSTTFTKSIWCFSQRILHKLLPNFECHHIPVNRSCCRLTTFFTNFHSKFEMPFYMKVVSLDKLDNFHIGRF